MRRIYLDYHTSSPIREEVIEIMTTQMSQSFGSILQPHVDGQKLIKEQEEALSALAEFVGANPNDNLVFTASKSEAINHIFDHVYNQVIRETGRSHIVSLSTEEASILLSIQKLSGLGCQSTLVDLDDQGEVDIQKITEAITPRTSLISLHLADGLTGKIHDIQEIVKLCKLRKILLHIDVSYAIGKMRINFKELGADFLTFGGDVIGAARTSGLLVAKEEVKLGPFIVGESEQNGLRGASLDMASLLGFAKACSFLKEQELNLETPRLRDLFEKKCTAIEGISVLFKTSRLPNVSVITVNHIHCDALLYALNKRGVSASMGGGKFQKLSYLLEKMSVSSKQAATALSFSLSEQTTKEDILRVTQILEEEVKRLGQFTEKLESTHA